MTTVNITTPNEKRIFGTEFNHLSEVDSTNNYTAKAFLNKEIGAGAVILADNQSSGKGQRGNVWLANSGENLLISFLFCPDNLSVYQQSALTWATSLAVWTTLDYFNIAAQIKWPNDVLVNGKKIAGILIENSLSQQRIERSIIGIGLNVNQNHFENLPATSMCRERNSTFERTVVLNSLVERMNQFFSEIEKYNFSELKKRYLEQLYLLREPHTFEDENGIFQGEILGVSDEGLLLVNRAGRMVSYGVKEIKLVKN